MPRSKRTPEEIARKAKVRELMQELDVHDMSDINALFKEFVGDILENGLEAELDDELGYSKYDYRNKETDNSRNGHSRKTMKTSFGEVDIDVPRNRKGEFEPQLVKKHGTGNTRKLRSHGKQTGRKYPPILSIRRRYGH